MIYNENKLNELASYYSDYHKDVHGFRPRGWDVPTETLEYRIRDLERRIASLDAYMDHMKSTEEGRARLREEGWYV